MSRPLPGEGLTAPSCSAWAQSCWCSWGSSGAKGKAGPIRALCLPTAVLGGERGVVLKEHSPELPASAITSWKWSQRPPSARQEAAGLIPGIRAASAPAHMDGGRAGLCFSLKWLAVLPIYCMSPWSLNKSSWCQGTAGAHTGSRAGWNDPALVHAHKPGSQRCSGSQGAGRYLGLLTKSLSTCLYIWSLGTCQTTPKRTMDSSFLLFFFFFSQSSLWQIFPSERAFAEWIFSSPCVFWYLQVPAQFPGVWGSTVLLCNLILQRTKPKDLELLRCQFFILWHAQKFCSNFLLSSLGLMRLKRMIGRKEIIIYSLFFSQSVPNVTFDLAFYFWHGLNSLYLFSSLHTITVT